MEKPVVGLTRLTEVPETPGDYSEKSLKLIRDALSRTIGFCVDFSAMVKGKSILIKPNLVRPNPHNPFAIVTDERVLISLCELARDAGARTIWVGDNPGYGLSLMAALSCMGEFKSRLSRLGVTLRYFDQEETVSLDNPEAALYDKMIVPRCLVEAECYINLPKMKTHMHTLVTMGIKNQYGLILDDERMFWHRNDVNAKLVDILRVVRPTLTVVDAIMAVQGQAPLSGSLVSDMNLILAGTDVVAVDSVGTACMSIEPNEVAMLRLAKTWGLGESDLEKIEVRGGSIEGARRSFKRPVVSCMGAYPEINCVEGGACLGCLSALRHALDKLHFEGKLTGRPVSTVYVGKPMPDQKNLKKIQGEFWCFGNCASELIFNHQKREAPARFIPGCPPHILEFYKAYDKD